MAAASLPDAVESAFITVLSTATPEDLEGYDLVPAKNYSETERKAPPFVLLNAGVQEARRRSIAGSYDVTLNIVLVTDATGDAVGATHNAALAALLGHINDKAATKVTINTDNEDLHVYDYFHDSQTTRQIETGEWETELIFTVVVQAR